MTVVKKIQEESKQLAKQSMELGLSLARISLFKCLKKHCKKGEGDSKCKQAGHTVSGAAEMGKAQCGRQNASTPLPRL